MNSPDLSPQVRMRQALDSLAERVARIVEDRRADGDVDDTQRGLYFPPSLIVRDARTAPPEPDVVTYDDLPAPLRQLARPLGLTDVDLSLLLIASAVSIQPRFEHFFIVLNNEVESRGPMVATALLLAGAHVDDPQARARLNANAPLRRLGLIELRQNDRPLLSRTLVVPERVTDFLLGGDHIDPLLQGVLAPAPAVLGEELLPDLPEVTWPTLLRTRSGCAWQEQSIRLGRRWTELDPIVVDGSLIHGDDVANIVLAAVRECSLSERALVFDCRGMSGETLTLALRQIVEAGLPAVCVVDLRSSVPEWAGSEITLALPTVSQRRSWWRALGAPPDGDAMAEAITHLEPRGIHERITQKSTSGHRLSSMRHGLVQQITPAFGLADLVLDAQPRQELSDLAARVRYRGLVLDEWGMRPGGGRGRGVAALFTGAPGTGKSMAAEALAGELAVPLFRVELATVVDKYIGETEKNLDRVFSAVENTDGVLLFDEADALFGKRSEVSDARDRYANIEVAYLLQRMESFDGLAILTTNLRANLDPAFVRRLDAIVEFPEPDMSERARLWQSCLGNCGLTLTSDQSQELAAIPMAGGAIRAAVLTAAYLAASRGEQITAADLVEAGQREWRKMGRLAHPGLWQGADSR